MGTSAASDPVLRPLFLVRRMFGGGGAQRIIRGPRASWLEGRESRELSDGGAGALLRRSCAPGVDPGRGESPFLQGAL